MRRGLRAGFRSAIAAFFLLLLALPALPAAAADGTNVTDIGQIGDVRSPDGLSLAMTLGLYVGVPAAAFLLAGILALRSRDSGNRLRYRPGRPWNHEPIWFGDESALEHEPQRAALPGAGGASGRW